MRIRLEVALSLALIAVPALAGEPLRVSALDEASASAWDARIEALAREGSLALRQSRPDTLLAGREHERFQQLYRGVPVYGGELVRQTDAHGAVSVFGSLYEGIELDVTPRLAAEQATAAVERLSGGRPFRARPAELVVLPKDDGGYALAWRLRAYVRGDVIQYFVDATSGAVVLEHSDLKRQAAVGTGTGVLGDRKKVSASPLAGGFVADDKLRPPSLKTNDFRGNISRVIDFLVGDIDLAASDLASDSDNQWSDGANVDAHAHAGYVYDYYFKRFGRRGLNDANIPLINLVHPVSRADQSRYSDDIVFLFYYNAAYFGDGIMMYGEGSDVPLFGQRWNYTSGSLDIVAHELTHGVTDYSSSLIYRNESGALNEAFSDIMSAGVEFFFHPAGSGLGSADYLLGEDVIVPGGIRSMSDPRSFGDPDNYSIRFKGSADNGGVHINSGIANHAFYLAIEGGTNRTSGLPVQGVGSANREQIEKAFYRAFVFMLPPSANFSTARAATIQAARDLYGAGSAAERAITQAWTAVGVN